MSRKKTAIGESRQEQLLGWAQSALLASGVKNVELARASGLTEDQVSKLLSGSRLIQEHEAQIISSLTGRPIPPLPGFPPPPLTGRVKEIVFPVQWAHPTVIIAPGLWRDKGSVPKMSEQIPLSLDPRLAGLKQYVCKIEGENSYVNCVELSGKPRAESVVHVRRTRADQHEDTLWKVEFEDGELRLVMDGADPLPAANLPSDVVIQGVVVGRYIPVIY